MTKKQFNRLSQKNQRVFLAKDVLEQLRIGKFQSNRGKYIANNEFMSYMNETDEYKSANAKEVLQKLPECFVCAQGALVCSYVLNFNEKTVYQIQNNYINKNKEMLDIFGVNLWNFIEMLFEGRNKYVDATGSIIEKYNKNCKQWSMKALMKNIVRNNGVLNYNGLIIK